MKINFGSFEVSGVTVHFAYEEANIWINVTSMSDYIAGGKNMGVSADFLVADAQKRWPGLTREKAVRLPIISASGKPSADYQWYYRIDLDLALFGLHPAKKQLVETEIHQPLLAGLQKELMSQ